MNFILKRIVVALFTMFLVSVFCFIAFNVIRGDPASIAAGINATPEQLQMLREEMGINRGVFPRYIDWLTGFLSGNYGNSLRFRGEAISAMVAHRLPVTFSLAVFSLLLIFLISIPLSLFTVNKEGGKVDLAVNFLTAAGISAPG